MNDHIVSMRKFLSYSIYFALKKNKKQNMKTVRCSATVGQQYNTVSRQPAYAAWLRDGRELEDTAMTRISQRWTDDDIVLHLRLEISAVADTDEGEYTCKVQNQYGVLEREVRLAVEDDIEDRNENLVRREMSSIFRKQIKLYSMLARLGFIEIFPNCQFLY